jgi:hypothetical protein
MIAAATPAHAAVSPVLRLLAAAARGGGVRRPAPRPSLQGAASTGGQRIGYFGPPGDGGGIVTLPSTDPGQRIGWFGPGGGGITTLPAPPAAPAPLEPTPQLPQPPHGPEPEAQAVFDALHAMSPAAAVHDQYEALHPSASQKLAAAAAALLGPPGVHLPEQPLDTVARTVARIPATQAERVRAATPQPGTRQRRPVMSPLARFAAGY